MSNWIVHLGTLQVSNEWFLFNDSQVTKTSFDNFSSISKRFQTDLPYMLFYKRSHERMSISTENSGIPSQLDTTSNISDKTSSWDSLYQQGKYSLQLPSEIVEEVIADNTTLLLEQENQQKVGRH